MTTTADTGGVTVRMTPEGLDALAHRDAKQLKRLLPRLAADQHQTLFALLPPDVVAELQTDDELTAQLARLQAATAYVRELSEHARRAASD